MSTTTTRRLGVALVTAALVATAAGSASGATRTTKKTTRTTKKVTTTKPTATTKGTASTAATTAPATTKVAAQGNAGQTVTTKVGDIKQGDTITIGLAAAPNTLDPAKSGIQPQQTYPASMAYEPLIRLNADNSYSPGLAESWSFDGLNETFTIKLRSGLKFADGTPIDSAAAVASMQYFQKNSPAGLTVGATVKDIKAIDPLTIQVTQTSANPSLARYYSTNFLAGSLISPAGLANPDRISTQSFGAGPYVFDAGQSVLGSTYVYTPNKNFYDQKLVYWKKVVFRVIPDINARLQAVQTGQVDTAAIDGTVYAAAKAAGLGVSVGAPNAVLGVVLADRTGAINKALADQDVRTALSYAIDRAAVCKATLGEAGGSPTANFASYDYDESLDTKWSYDEAKAKKMLADAGYPNGFKLTLEATATPPFSTVGQAIAGMWKKVGVDVELTSNPSIPASQTAQRSKQYAAYVYGYGHQQTQTVATAFVGGVAGSFNPFGSSDPQIADWLNQAPVLPAADASKLYKKAFARGLDLGWVVNVCNLNFISVGNKRVDGWQNPKIGSFPYPNQYFAAQ